jgi:hypothetical protein
MSFYIEKPSHKDHQLFINSILDKPIEEIQFKNNSAYTAVLENLSKDFGTDMLKYIETNFPQVTFEDMRAFIQLNDKYGGTIKSIFTTSKMKLLYCSPSTLRYMLQALVILSYYNETMCKNVVELGQAYGGLFLAINMFAKKFPNVQIKKYIMVDLPNSSNLTRKYLEAHRDSITIPYEVYDSMSLPSVPTTTDPQCPNESFFISNYSFTAMEKSEMAKYKTNLIAPCTHGFFVWQTIFGDWIDNADETIGKNVIKRVPEDPRTAPLDALNYFVYF